jgi:hypothetical protein
VKMENERFSPWNISQRYDRSLTYGPRAFALLANNRHC